MVSSMRSQQAILRIWTAAVKQATLFEGHIFMRERNGLKSLHNEGGEEDG